MCFTAQLDTGGIFPYSFESIARWDTVRQFPHFMLQNAAARPIVPVVAMDNRETFAGMHWLLVPPWVTTTDKLKTLRIWTANARIEELEQKPLYRPLLKENRCVVLFTGFYEWRHERNGTKTRYFLSFGGNEPMLLPGLFRHGTIDGEPYTSCTVCTMEARGIMRYIHNSTLRQPVVLKKNDIDRWLDPTLSFEQARAFTIEKESSSEFIPDPALDDLPGDDDTYSLFGGDPG